MARVQDGAEKKAAADKGIKPLSKRQQEVFYFVFLFARTNGFQPSLSEIARKFQFKSNNSASLHIRAIVKKQWAELDGTRFNRNLAFIRTPDGVLFQGF